MLRCGCVAGALCLAACLHYCLFMFIWRWRCLVVRAFFPPFVRLHQSCTASLFISLRGLLFHWVVNPIRVCVVPTVVTSFLLYFLKVYCKWSNAHVDVPYFILERAFMASSFIILSSVS
ncbi:hypothetical protein, unlikely [Trypanosoma brucei gambiense DAL972]|uniref:Uncharacterized protein n=1 Tax=Trypanosoma brucei gambiense (strain MHOM/CI/86/DAL972) TaxID=679716 RepID=C9ZL72_TRYB9|nr:hypothetical protein, unlikely [Trypanosoma brucei gambiense DAL972]CBH10081.1 hypothetical protein, unlikely [Trypanosoma brucei gambiense DAL972]|eukprot:XP_011772371.1 hypothetical protein, unlikely [Trypanosoma brucei gambiense DAL972]